MKNVFLFALTLFFYNNSFSQIISVSIEVIPENPSNFDDITLIVNSKFSYSSSSLSNSSFTTTKDSVLFNLCYNVGDATAFSETIDTLLVGQLPEGKYTLYTTSKVLDNADTLCNSFRDSSISSIDLMVENATSILENTVELFKVYSVDKILYIKSLNSNKTAELMLFDINGKLLLKEAIIHQNTEIDISNIGGEILFYSITSNDQNIHQRGKISIE